MEILLWSYLTRIGYPAPYLDPPILTSRGQDRQRSGLSPRWCFLIRTGRLSGQRHELRAEREGSMKSLFVLLLASGIDAVAAAAHATCTWEWDCSQGYPCRQG